MNQTPAKPKKAKVPSRPPVKGGTLAIKQFRELMAFLNTRKSELTNEQVQFVQVCQQTFHDHNEGVVKVQLRFPKHRAKTEKKSKGRILDPLGHGRRVTNTESLDELVALASESEVLRAIETMSVQRLEAIARQNTIEADSETSLRSRLLERVMTLRQIERIATAKKPIRMEKLNSEE